MPAAFFFFCNDTATTEIYTLSLHDALPIPGSRPERLRECKRRLEEDLAVERRAVERDRKSTRLNSSHQIISYAVSCLKKTNQVAALADHEERAVVRSVERDEEA